MKTIKVYSPIEDKSIRENLLTSPIWSKSYHDDELVLAKKNHDILYEYCIKFEGVKPIQFTTMKKISN